MGDSWEDSAAPPPVKPASLLQRGQGKSGLNPNANSFSFSPGAASFVPSGAPEAPKPPPGFSMPTYPPPPGGSATSSSATPAQAAAEPQHSSDTTKQMAAAVQSTSAEAASQSRPSEAAAEATTSGNPGKNYILSSAILSAPKMEKDMLLETSAFISPRKQGFL